MYKVFLFLTVVFFVSQSVGLAAWPTPIEAPENSPSLQNRRISLAHQSDQLQSELKQQDLHCREVVEHTPHAEQCKEWKSKLLAKYQSYSSAVGAYNKEAAAAKLPKHPPVAGNVADLQKQFQTLSEEIPVDRQIIQNFGFEKTVDEIEYWGNLPARQVQDAKDAFKGMLFDATLEATSQAAGAIGSLTPEQVDALNRLANAQGSPPLGIVAGTNGVHKALEFLQKTKGTYEAADAVRKKQIFTAAITLGGLASKNPAHGLLLNADGWAAYQVYQSVTAVRTVNNLTQMNENDLVRLKARSEKLKHEVDQLKEVKKQLAKVSSEQDSTTLVRKPE